MSTKEIESFQKAGKKKSNFVNSSLWKVGMEKRHTNPMHPPILPFSRVPIRMNSQKESVKKFPYRIFYVFLEGKTEQLVIFAANTLRQGSNPDQLTFIQTS